MVHSNLKGVLEATGYLADGQPAHGVLLGKKARDLHRTKEFVPDALWRSDDSALKWRDDSALTVYFKHEPKAPSGDRIAVWRREIWNRGFAPLLWVVSPEKIDVYNGFGRPEQDGDADTHRLKTFERVETELEKLDAFAGRLAMETGRFWETAPEVNRKTSVDRQLLRHLHALERDLMFEKLKRPAAQGLIGRSIFAQYLIDRKIVTPEFLDNEYGHRTLAAILRERNATERLFGWLRDTFNGDMFLPEDSPLPKAEHLCRVANFLDGAEPESGQRTLFPYQFDVIPVELISSIYEQFANAESQPGDAGAKPDVFYTRLSLVSLILDEIMDGLEGTETVLDLTCGSGVFLVEALRRLVKLRSGANEPDRETIRDVLHKQIYGVDISEAAVRVAAFSLYLAALELDPDPKPPHVLKFDPLIGKTLIVDDAWSIENVPESEHPSTMGGKLGKFDIIVGNPPWSYSGKTARNRERLDIGKSGARSPRGPSLDFVRRTMELSTEKTRFGLVLSAVNFFGRSQTATEALRDIIEELSPVTLIDLSYQRDWLFRAKLPAMVLLSKNRRLGRAEEITAVQVPWSSAGARTHTFNISREDIITIPRAELEDRPWFLKAMFFGLRRDLAFLNNVTSRCDSLDCQLQKIGTKLCSGLIAGDRSRKSGFLTGMPLLTKQHIGGSFVVPNNLPTYEDDRAQWPRKPGIYRAPLLLIKGFMGNNGRPSTAVATRDTVFTDAIRGAALPSTEIDIAYMLAAILKSALASWFFLMTASMFGLSMRHLLLKDIEHMPVPDLKKAKCSDIGRRLIATGRRSHEPSDADLRTLDEDVFNLYGLDSADRIVVQDGLFRARWQWKPGRIEAAAAADPRAHVRDEYARAFLTAIDVWLSAGKRHRMRGEVIDLPPTAPLRIARFVLEEGTSPSTVEIIPPNSSLREILDRIGARLKVRLGYFLAGQRALRIYGPDEVVIVKPAARRHWMGVSALEDADAVVMDSLRDPSA